MDKRFGIDVGTLLLCAGIAIGTAAVTSKADNGAGNSGAGTGPSVPRDLLHVPTGGSTQIDRTKPVPLPPQPNLPDQQTNLRPRGRGLQVPSGNPGVWDEKSWVSWWETNRDAVLKQVLAKRAARTARAGTGTAADKAPPEEQASAVAALLKAIHAERPLLRAAAAVSLGQMRQSDALDRLTGLAREDADPYVRGMAWLAVGLIGSPEAERALLAMKQPHDEFEQLGVIAGVGMLPEPSEPTFQMLRTLAAKPPSPEVGRAAVWALRVFHRAADHDPLAATMSSGTAPPQVVVEGLLALGAIGEPRDVESLADVASDGRSKAAPDQAVVSGGGYGRVNGTYQFREQSGLNGGAPVGGRSTTLVRRQRHDRPAASSPPSQFGGRSALARTSAVLALGPGEGGRSPISGNVRVQNALIQNFAPYLDQGGPIYAGGSILAFAAAATPRDVYVLRDLLDLSPDPLIGLVNPKSPLRGYAALGIGLYLANGGTPRLETRPIGAVAVGVDPSLPDYLDLNETLAVRYANRQESSELRAACAVALGLSGDPANAQRLLQGATNIGHDDMLLGYTSLALALLGEPSAVNAAGPLVAAGATRLDPDAVAARGVGQTGAAPTPPRRAGAPAEATPFDAPSVPQAGPAMASAVGRRAALLGLALLKDVRSHSILAGAWARDPAVVQDVARAMGWCHDYKAADALAQVVARDQKGAVEAAMSLGWVFDPDQPSRLSRLVVGNNYHQPQTDWVDRPEGSIRMVRNFPRVADLYLHSTPLGGTPVPAMRRAATTRPAVVRRTR